MENTINPSGSTPLYKQVEKILYNDIRSGKLKVGEKLPSELSLMETFNVSRITIRAAVSELVEDGFLVRAQGKGTFVAAPKTSYTANDLPGFTKSCRMAGKIARTRLLKIEYAYPSKSESEFLGIHETDQIISTKRLRYVDNYPTVVETNHYLMDFNFLWKEDLEGSLFEILAAHGIHVTNSTRTLEICLAKEDETELLGVPLETPLLLFKDKQTDANGRPIFVSRQVYNTENMTFYL